VKITAPAQQVKRKQSQEEKSRSKFTF